MTKVREPAVAGSFYPSDPDDLRTAIEYMIEQECPAQPGPAPKALIVPHAGYAYSGVVAAKAYAQLLSHRKQYHRVVLLGPAHRIPLRGLALPAADEFQSPLGTVAIDQPASHRLNHPPVSVFEAAHQQEHSLEVQLPFLQVLLGSFRLTPLVVGDTEMESVAEIIEALWDGPETLVIVSSDLSHYLGYRESQLMDRRTCDAIEAMDAHRIGHDDACGATPLGGLLISARRRGLQIRTLDLRNSGDTAGRRTQVVGYGSWMLWEEGKCGRAA